MNIDSVVSELRRDFHKGFVASLDRNGRNDVLAGYGEYIIGNEYDRKYGQPKYTKTTFKDGRISITRSHNVVRSGQTVKQVTYYKDKKDPMEVVEHAYNELVAKGEKPNNKWKKEIKKYVPKEYIKKVQQYQDAVIAEMSPMDICIFASCVPGANVKSLQNEIIKSNNPLAVLTFAEMVDNSDIDALRTAIGKMEDKENLTSELKVDYLSLFNYKFGSGDKKQHQPE